VDLILAESEMNLQCSMTAGWLVVHANCLYEAANRPGMLNEAYGTGLWTKIQLYPVDIARQRSIPKTLHYRYSTYTSLRLQTFHKLLVALQFVYVEYSSLLTSGPHYGTTIAGGRFSIGTQVLKQTNSRYQFSYRMRYFCSL
jgi:hypothetical protein